MKTDEKTNLIQLIDKAEMVSFDVFDTLLFRRVNEPETIFDLVGKHYGVHGFRKLRMDEQNEASRKAYAAFGHPHADMNEIYEKLGEHKEIPVNWNEVKEYEIQMEKDALTANKEMLEIFLYAKERGKRVVAISDMYLLADTLSEILEENGFIGFDHVYCSADEHKAKFNRDLFSHVAEIEQVTYNKMLHIGDNPIADAEIPKSFGIQTWLYKREIDASKINNVADADVDKGLYKILYDDNKSFWYNLGVEVGGPLYMGLYRWLQDKIRSTDKKIYFLARDGYNLYHLFKNAGYENIEYLYTSRRALLLAGIKEMNEDDIRELPPYTKGQTVGEILDYLCIPKEKIKNLREAGFHSFGDVIKTEEDAEKFRNLYRLDRETFLERCEWERKNAVQYFKNTGFLDKDTIVFDCGWSGSSQVLIDRFKKAIGCEYNNFFYYFGIRNTEKSRRQLHGKHYETYAFDFCKNYALQAGVNEAVVMYELFFSAPHESVFYYDKKNVVFEDGKGSFEKELILDGIQKYIEEGLPFVEKYNVEYTPDMAVSHLQRLIMQPTEEEAVQIGNLNNVDGFARQDGVEKYIAYVTEQQFTINPAIEIYWVQGLLKRKDISENLKIKIAEQRGLRYPEMGLSEYHLEDEASIRNYHRWIRYQNKHKKVPCQLRYKPKFSVVIPVYNTVTEQLKEAIDSVLTQTYTNFELILVDDHSSWENVVPVLRSYEENSHVQVIYRETNGHISVATNDGIKCATGEFIAFMDCDDIIDPDALYEMAKMLNENPELDFIYSDEDKITEDGKIRHLPFFKPDWSPDLFMSMMYTNHLAIYRTSIVKKIGGLRSAYDGCQDYDMTLRFMEKSNNKKVGHVSKILYHWRERKESLAFAVASKNYATEATRYAKEDALRRRKLKGHMEFIPEMSQYRTVYEIQEEPLVSIIIPSKDHPDVLKQCIDSIIGFTSYSNYEIIVVDNGSNDENKEEIERYLENKKIKYIYNSYEFNFSKMCNIGSNASRGEYVLFLNDDVEIIQSDWMSRMMGQAMLPHVGCVGAKLFYPESTVIQHAGVSNIKEGPSHNFLWCDDSASYSMGFNWIDYDCIVVTGACLLVSKKIFNDIGNFDESFPVAYNDVDLCFRVYEAGYYNVVRNDVVAYHHESLSRGTDQIDDKKLLRLSGERQYLYHKHPRLDGRDPFLNQNLHNYGAVLDLNIQFDEVEMTNSVASTLFDSGNVDYIHITDKIRVIGWSYLPNHDDNIELERYIIFEDPYGNQYRASANLMSRPDVVACLGRDDLLYSGFECVVDKTVLRMDFMQYKVGVQTIDKAGKSYVMWPGINSNVIRNPQVRQEYCTNHKLMNYEYRNSKKTVQWYIENKTEEKNDYRIRGWAFCDGNNHYRYKKQVLLKADDGETYQFDVLEEDRLDVAGAFPGIHFLYYTGFCCNIYKNILPSGHEYDVILRLKNLFDDTDVNDIITGEKIRIGE